MKRSIQYVLLFPFDVDVSFDSTADIANTNLDRRPLDRSTEKSGSNGRMTDGEEIGRRISFQPLMILQSLSRTLFDTNESSFSTMTEVVVYSRILIYDSLNRRRDKVRHYAISSVTSIFISVYHAHRKVICVIFESPLRNLVTRVSLMRRKRKRYVCNYCNKEAR